MGKEWLYWGGSGGGGSTKRSGRSPGGGERDNIPSGCMNAVFQLFDLHHFRFDTLHHPTPSFKPDSFFPDEPIPLKGLEAPRNSLEIEGCFNGADPLSPAMKEEKKFKIPVGMQIKTTSKARPDDYSSECSSSPGSKTPNLVARLMGLDLLPEISSPRPSSSSSSHSNSNSASKSHLNPQVQSLKEEIRACQLLQSRLTGKRNSSQNDATGGTRSLPESPRISSARRSDVDYHHRLSLQINKENVCVGQDNYECSSSHLTVKLARRREEVKQVDENRNPSHYAKQIVKQVKESVSRRVGLDITNTVKNRQQARHDHEHIVLLKSKKASTRTGDDSSQSKQSTTPSSSPRLKFMVEPKNKVPVTTVAIKNRSSQSSKLPSSKFKPEAPLQDQHHQEKCKKTSSERYGARLKKPPQTSDVIRNKQEEPFVRSSDKKCKRTPLSSDLLNINVPTLLSVKKDPSPPLSRFPEQEEGDTFSRKRSAQLPNCSSHSYKQERTHTHAVQGGDDNNNNRSNGATASLDGDDLHHYISNILNRTGLNRSTHLSFTKWYSPSHPLDPSIFHHLELSNTPFNSELSQLCNRKLAFQLANEVLAKFLKPWITSHQMHGAELVEALLAKIRSFPSANCRVQDIDALIDKDLSLKNVTQRFVGMALEEESEGIVTEMERGIMDMLVHETAMVVFGQ
ncbi:hypothetical protein RJ640_022933 [Escallonia rubra]|uniref:Uncharacterized protein n=1 Tax=Escallonia rubra TaxID=112253 RepID=A0AA88S291_9ASTE|nr:hypothetical protein RJ640_022933 [Escallonia rubra]